MSKYLLWALCALILLFSDSGLSYIGVASKLDDLYRIAIKSAQCKGMSQQAFKASIKSGKVARFAPLIRSLPKEDRLVTLLEIADEKTLISGTQQLRLASKYSKLDDGDELLMQVIDHGDRALFDLVPQYGSKLLQIESTHQGAGVSVVTNLGDAGWKVMNQIPEGQIPRFATQAKSIASLDPGPRAQFLDAITKYPVKALEYLDANSSIAYKAAGITGFLVFVDNLSQPKTTIVTQPDGTVIETQASPLGGWEIDQKYFHWFIWIGLAGFSLWLSIQLWGSLKKKRADLSRPNGTEDLPRYPISEQHNGVSSIDCSQLATHEKEISSTHRPIPPP